MEDNTQLVHDHVLLEGFSTGADIVSALKEIEDKHGITPKDVFITGGVCREVHDGYSELMLLFEREETDEDRKTNEE